jgi:hypothetical protein
MCDGVSVWLGWSGIRVAGSSLVHGYHPGFCCTATTRLGRARSNINTKHNKYNRHATTNPITLSLVTEVKKKNISLRMVKN